MGAQCFHPSAAYSPVQDRYLVVWQLTSGPEASGDIEGEFITHSGVPNLYIPIRLAGNNDSFAQPDVAFNHRRNEYLVAFQLTDCATFPCDVDILGHRVNYLGEVLDGSYGIKIGYHTVLESDPAVAAYPDPTESKCWNKSTLKYLVVWTITTNIPLNTSSIIGMELNTSGDPVSPPRLIGGWFGTQGTVAAGPHGDFLAAYTESVAFGQQQVLGSLWGNRVYIPLVRK